MSKQINEKKDKGSGLIIVECETSPPKRYSESSLVKKLDDLNIGRPSTMATIIGTLLDPGRGYCEEQGKALVPTEKGTRLIHFMKEAFPEIIDYNYTAKMEEGLDKISKGSVDRVDYLKDFYSDLENQIKSAKGIQGEKAEVEYADDKVCPLCGSKLIKRNGRFGPFYSCSAWPKCKFTEKIV